MLLCYRPRVYGTWISPLSAPDPDNDTGEPVPLRRIPLHPNSMLIPSDLIEVQPLMTSHLGSLPVDTLG